MTKQRVAKWTSKDSDVNMASSACASIYKWLQSILNYHTVIQDIIPKEQAAKEAEKMLDESEEKLRKVQARAKDLEDKLQKLKDQLDGQQAYKAAAQAAVNPWLIKSLVLLILLLVSVTKVPDWQRRSKNIRKKRHLLLVTCYL